MSSPPKKLASPRGRISTWFDGDDWRDRIISFNASWFTASMGTGVLAQVLYNFPYNAQWIKNLAYCFWVLAILMFIFFMTLFIIRAVRHPMLTKDIFKDFYQTSFLGCIAITIFTIAVPFVLFYGEYMGAVWVAYAFFWVGVVVALLVGCIMTWIVEAVQEPTELSSVNGIWLLSFIPLLVGSAAGGTIIPYLPTEVRGATLIVCFMLWSIGAAMTFIITAIYFWRLVQYKLPMRTAIVSCFIPVGPGGMAAYAISNLGAAMYSYLVSTSFNLQRPSAPPAPYDTSANTAGRTYHIAQAEAVHWVATLLALFFLAFATFWQLQGVLSVLYRMPKQFNVGQWAFVFPNAVYSNGLSKVALDLNNHGLRGWAAAISVITVLLWLYCALSTTYVAVWQGRLLFAPGLEGWNEQHSIDGEKQRESSEKGEKQDLSSSGSQDSDGSAQTSGHESNNNGGGESRLDHRLDGTYTRRKEPGNAPNGSDNV